jgi:uncharacterized protein involved in outer membrane biogenesis
MLKKLIVLVQFLALALIAVPSFSQETVANLSGHVADAAGLRVTILSGNTRIHTLPSLFIARVIA